MEQKYFLDNVEKECVKTNYLLQVVKLQQNETVKKYFTQKIQNINISFACLVISRIYLAHVSGYCRNLLLNC